MPFSAGRLALRTFGAFAMLAGVMTGAAAADKPTAPDDAALNLDQSIQALKDEVLQFNRDAAVAEDEFLYPPQTRLVVYLSTRLPDLILTEVRVTVDDEAPVVVNYDLKAGLALVTPNALQRVLRANIARGSHRIRVSFVGNYGDAKKKADPATGQYEALFDKTMDPSELELVIIKGARRNAPTMQLKEWRMEE